MEMAEGKAVKEGDIIIATEVVSEGPGNGVDKRMEYSSSAIKVVELSDTHIRLDYAEKPSLTGTTILTAAEFETGKFVTYPFKEEG